MKPIYTISILILLFILSCQSKSVAPFQIQIDSISKHWVPDKRIGICDIKVINGAGEQIILKGESMFPQAKAEALKLFRNEGISIIDSVVILPDTLASEKQWALVNLSVANIRSKPAHSSEMLTQAIMGTPMRVLKIFEGWVMVQTPDRYIGWTNKNAVQLMTYSEITHWQKSPRMMYLRGDGSLFSDLSKTSVVSDLVAGAIVVMIDNHKRNIKVELPDGRTGFVSSQDWVNFNSWRDTVMLRSEPMITFGKQFMGFPYLWGGTSSKGMDCSGFVKTVCFLNGIILERDASQQIHHGVEIDITQGYDKLQKGDLLFFGSRTPYRVNHVGIYIGNSEVIHESGNVHINSLEKSRTNFNPELSANLVGARRIIGASAEQGILPTRMHQWY